MEKLTNWFNEKFIPATMAFGELKYLKALRDGMIVAVPLTFIGSIFLILSNLPIPGWYDTIAPISKQLGVMSSVTIGLTGLVMAIGLGYQVSKLNEIDPLSGTAIVVICYVITMLTPEFEVDPGLWGSGGIFSAIIVSIVAAEIMRFFYKHKITIKLPSSVPPAVFNSFAALIPASVAIFFFWLVRVGLNVDINTLINSMFAPLVFGLNSIWGVLIMTLLTCVLWMVDPWQQRDWLDRHAGMDGGFDRQHGSVRGRTARAVFDRGWIWQFWHEHRRNRRHHGLEFLHVLPVEIGTV